MNPHWRVSGVTINIRFRSDTGIILSPVQRYATPMLNIRGIIRIFKQLRTRCMERGCEHLGNDLLCFHIVSNVTLSEMSAPLQSYEPERVPDHSHPFLEILLRQSSANALQ
jgi:hypothetical protein